MSSHTVLPEDPILSGNVSHEQLVARPPITSRVAWSAVFAGGILAFGGQALLGLLGAGVGFSTVDPLQGDTPSLTTMGTAAMLWLLFSGLVSLFFGGWVAGRLSGTTSKGEGMLHGLLAWALSTLIVFYFLGAAAWSVVGGTLNLVGGSVATVAQPLGRAATQALTGVDVQDWNTLRNEAHKILRDTGKPGLQPERLEEAGKDAQNAVEQTGSNPDTVDGVLEQLLRQGQTSISQIDREAAVNLLMSRSNMTRPDAETSVNNAIKAYEDAKQQLTANARVAADRSAESLSKGALWGFIGLVLAAAGSACGGMVGVARRRPITVREDRYDYSTHTAR